MKTFVECFGRSGHPDSLYVYNVNIRGVVVVYTDLQAYHASYEYEEFTGWPPSVHVNSSE